MKLAEIHFDWAPVIPGADPRGENLLFPLRGTSIFRAVDGWSIERLPSASPEFRLHRTGMPLPVVVGDGYTYIEVPGEKLTVEVDLHELDTLRDAAEASKGSKRARKVKP